MRPFLYDRLDYISIACTTRSTVGSAILPVVGPRGVRLGGEFWRPRRRWRRPFLWGSSHEIGVGQSVDLWQRSVLGYWWLISGGWCQKLVEQEFSGDSLGATRSISPWRFSEFEREEVSHIHELADSRWLWSIGCGRWKFPRSVV